MQDLDNLKDDVLEGLEKNPLFQMSLGSKELFHSNFLAWILGLEKQKKFAIEYFRHLFSDQLSNSQVVGISAPEREKMNIDLIFTLMNNDGNSFNVIFENKVKSLAYKEQLIDYHKKINSKNSNDIFCLLSLTPPNFIQEPWLIKSYNDVANSLRYASRFLVEDDILVDIKSLIAAYIDFIQLLDGLGTTLLVNDDEKFDYSKNSFRNKLQKLRIHDLYLKFKHQQLSDNLNEICVEKGLSHITTNPWKEILDCEGKYFTSSGFSNSNGLLDFKYVIRSIAVHNYFVHVILGIQIQGQQLRYVVEIGGKGTSPKEKEKSFEIAKALYEKELWVTKPLNITNSTVCDNEIKGAAKDKKSKYHDFCSYSGCFVYKYSEISTISTVSDLLEYNSQLIDHILNNKLRIKSIVDDVFSN